MGEIDRTFMRRRWAQRYLEESKKGGVLDASKYVAKFVPKNERGNLRKYIQEEGSRIKS